MTEISSETEQEEKNGGWTLKRYVLIGGAGLGLVIILPFVLGLIIALLADPEPTAIRFGMIRDIIIIVIVLQGILVILALTILILQVARLVALLQNEIRPILRDAKDTAETAKGTAAFVGQNVVQPVIGIRSFFAGMRTFGKELFGIRRAIRPSKQPHSLEESSS